jgi:hypothetical protein
MLEDLTKLLKVIDSCETKEQLNPAFMMMLNYNVKHKAFLYGVDCTFGHKITRDRFDTKKAELNKTPSIYQYY